MVRKKRSKFKKWLTDIDRRGIYASPRLIRIYQGLPNIMSRISTLLFADVCESVRYGPGKVKEGFSFISTTIPKTIDDILLELNSIAYSEGKDIKNHRKNFKKKSPGPFIYKCQIKAISQFPQCIQGTIN